MDELKIAAVFKALGDENRIRILKLLHGGEKCACKLLEELNISQPTLSLPSMIMLRKAVKPKLLGIFIAICTVGIIFAGYSFVAGN